MRHAEERLIISLIKKDEKKITYIIEQENIRWNIFMEIISIHKIVLYILNRLQPYPLPPEARMYLNSHYKRIMILTFQDRSIFYSEWKKIKDIFLDKSIDCILMKGPSIHSSEWRMIGDLDILVKKKDIGKAKILLEEAGYNHISAEINETLTDAEKKDWIKQMKWNNQFQFLNKKTNLMVELHINLFPKEKILTANMDIVSDNIDSFWNNKKYDKDLRGDVFSSEDLLILMCLHCAIKRSPANNTFIFRNVLDIDSIITRGVDWKRIVHRAEDLHIASFIYFSLKLTHKLYNTTVPKHVLLALYNICTGMEQFFTRIHQRCLKSFNSYSLVYSFVYKCYSPLVYSKNWIKKVMWFFAVPVFFTTKQKLMRSFHIKKESPLLFLAYYVYPFKKLGFFLKNLLHL